MGVSDTRNDGGCSVAIDAPVPPKKDSEVDRMLLLKNNHAIQEAQNMYPKLVIDYSTDPPPPPPPAEVSGRGALFYRLIEGWAADRIINEQRHLSNKKESLKRVAKSLSKEEERLLEILNAKLEDWGNEYYERIKKKVDKHQEMIDNINKRLQEERDKYPYKSVIDLDKFRGITQCIKDKGYHERSCFVTGLCYKEDVLGVGLEIVTEADTDRKVFQCHFDLISKEGFYDFGVRTGVWKDSIKFWMPAAIDQSHFRRALPLLAACFKELGDSRVASITRSYGTQAGSTKFNLKAQLREAERTGQKIISLEEFRAQKATPAKEVLEKTVIDAAGLAEQDMAFALEVLPKLMNLQTVQLMKGDLHLSTKALEGYMGFHHLLLSILRHYPNLQKQVESKIHTFLRNEGGRTKTGCPNMGEFLCLLAVSRKYSWDDVSAAVLKETLDRNASWAIDKFEVLKGHGIRPEVRLEKTFKASIVSIRLLCFNVWFLRNIVFKRYGQLETVASIVAAKREGSPLRHPMDLRYEEYEHCRGIPKPNEIEALQEHLRKMMHGEGLNSWTEYFVNLNLKPIKAKDLSQLLSMSLGDAVAKGYIPLWKLQPKPKKEKAVVSNDYMGADMDKYG